MAFSPETYALLHGLIGIESTKIDNLKTDVENNYWSNKTAIQPTENMIQKVEDAWTAANTNLFTGSFSSATWCIIWFGMRATQCPINKALVIVSGPDGCYPFIFARDNSTNTWSYTALVK